MDGVSTAILAQAHCGKEKGFLARPRMGVAGFQLAAERLVRSRSLWLVPLVVLGWLEPRPQCAGDEQLLPGWADLGDFSGATWK